MPGKVDGSAQYGIDFALPGMRVATVMAAPVRGGKLEKVDPAPAMAIKGVEKVVQLDDAVAVIATGYWPALKGLRALAPQFSDGGHGGVNDCRHVRRTGKAQRRRGRGFRCLLAASWSRPPIARPTCTTR